MSPLPSLLVVACAVALASAATPTKAPTYRVKTEAEIKMLATCASSRGSTANNVYTESAALKEVQKRRSGGRTGFDFAKKLDDFDIDIGALSKGDIDSPENRELGKKYTTSLIYAVVPSFFLLFLGVICCVPCWFCKTCGECSSCLGGKDGKSCAGRGCCGKCNDYFMGWTCCPNFGLFDGACRYGPIADYPTCGWFALYGAFFARRRRVCGWANVCARFLVPSDLFLPVASTHLLRHPLPPVHTVCALSLSLSLFFLSPHRDRRDGGAEDGGRDECYRKVGEIVRETRTRWRDHADD